MAALSLACTLLAVVDHAPASAAREWYVAPWGSNDASGSLGAPLRTVRSAVFRASHGDTIVLRGGTYRESIQVYGKRLHIRSHWGERATFDGSVPVDGWRWRDGDWYVDGWTRQFHRERTGGSVSPSSHVAGYPDQVFVDGRPLAQVLSRSAVVPGTFFHDTDADRIWIGTDPRGRRVDVSHESYGIYFNRAHGSSLVNVNVRRYATERRYMAAVRGYADDLTFAGVRVEHNARIGLSATGSNIVIRHSHFRDNGHLGLHVDRSSTFVVERSAVKGNNKASFDPLHSAGGLKVTSSSGVTIRDSDVSFNAGPGVWTDLDTTHVTVARNRVQGNGRAGIEIELSGNVNVLSNVTVGNAEAGIWVLESQDVQVLHNASFGNTIAVEIEEGPRRHVRNVRVHNNTMGRPRPGAPAALVVRDWTAERSAAEMGVSIDFNAYWLPSGSPVRAISRWDRWPAPPGTADVLPDHHRVTGQGYNSVLATGSANVLARSADTLDYRGHDWLHRGSALSSGAADELGVTAGHRLRIGPVAPVVSR